jgi:hypothetical protein
MQKGLGDTIEWITTKTRLNKLAPKNCTSCGNKKIWLNKNVPYKTKKQ